MCEHKGKGQGMQTLPRMPDHMYQRRQPRSLYNIKNSGEGDPSLIKYQVKTEEDISVQGKTWKYEPGTVDFNPSNYLKISIVGIVDKLNEGDAWQMDSIMSIEDHQLEVVRKHVNNKTLKQYGEAKVTKIKEVTKAIKEPKWDKTENRPATPPKEERKEKINKLGHGKATTTR